MFEFYFCCKCCGYRLSRNEFGWFYFDVFSHFFIWFVLFFLFFLFVCVLIWFVLFFHSLSPLLRLRLWWTFHESLMHTLSSFIIVAILHSLVREEKNQPKNWLIELPRNQNPTLSNSKEQVFVCSKCVYPTKIWYNKICTHTHSQHKHNH